MKTTSIKFFWNGMKVNGEKTLRKCYFSLSGSKDEEYIMIYSKGYGDSLPSDVFAVENETDYYTDYFDDDHARITPAHPLYKYVRAAALKGEIRSIEKYLPYCDNRAAGVVCADFYRKEAEDRRARLEKYRAELETLPSGQPTAADLEAVEKMNLAAETARIAAEQKAEQERREKYLAARVNGRDFITRTMDAHPIAAGAPLVRIQWSEAPFFASWNDNELEMSIAAAEIILAKYDAETAADEERGYYKTSFRIEWTDDSGEACSYEGRYDLGDNEGGLIAHLRAFAERGWIKDEAERASYKETADFLAGFIAPQEAAPVVVGVTVAPWFSAAVEAKKAQIKADEATAAAALVEAETQAREIYQAVELLTDDQLADAIKGLNADNETELTAARFFMQELYKRDSTRALRVFHEWRTGKTPDGAGARGV